MGDTHTDAWIDVKALSSFHYCPYKYKQEKIYKNVELNDHEVKKRFEAESDKRVRRMWQKEWERRWNEQKRASLTVDRPRPLDRLKGTLPYSTFVVAGLSAVFVVLLGMMGKRSLFAFLTAIFVTVFFVAFLAMYTWWRRRNRPVVIYRKTKRSKPLVCHEWKCQGKPDLIERYPGNRLVVTIRLPHDIDQNRKRPYEGDILQLGGYFLLANARYDVPVAFGRIEYRNRTFEIQSTDDLFQHVVKTIQRLRQFEQSEHWSYIQYDREKCRRCVFYETVCRKAITF